MQRMQRVTGVGRWALVALMALAVLTMMGVLAGCRSGEAVGAYNQGNKHFQAGNYTLAIVEYSRAILSDPDFTKAYNNRGVAYTHREQYDKAIKDFNAVLNLDPDYHAAYNNRGVAYYKQGEIEKAVADFQKTLELSEDANLRQQAEEALKEIEP
ncbi:MAG: tetratricopeptide repeat protein [Chloroflexaceae bacterium]|nr:tetratricopeptide repeat protein [Chloroflexaceae bacterium]